jgi:hypothetical protein
MATFLTTALHDGTLPPESMGDEVEPLLWPRRAGRRGRG